MSESGEKSFAPSAKRKSDAALKGDVLRCKELATAAAMLTGAAWLRFAGPWMFAAMNASLRTGLTWDRAAIDDFAPGRILVAALLLIFPPLLLLGGAVMLVSVGSQLGFGEGRWLPGNMAPKFSRINPLSGLNRMFGAQGWVEMAKGLGKVCLLGAIAWMWGRGKLGDVLALGRGDMRDQLALAWQALTSLFFALSVGLLVIALIDFPIQFLRRYLRLRMSQQDMRDEQKEAEGSPEKKAAIRQRQRQIAMGGVASAMRKAQFVITNPTHFSVALAYDPLRAAAPIVLAKGRGEKALAMRELAAEFELPCLEYPALARSVYFTTRENQVIREELFSAVAAVLAFVFSLRRGEQIPVPQVEVPMALRFDTEGRLDPGTSA